MNGVEFFLTRYVRISGMIRHMFADLSEAQIRVAPCEGVNSLAWLGWHVARVEDVGLNRFVLDDEQLFVRDGWETRLNVARRDFGTGMTPTEVRDLSMCIDLEQLRAYSDAVVERTLAVADRLQPEDLDTINDADYVQRVMDGDGFVTEDQSWVPDYMKGQPKGFFLCHLALTHKCIHVGEANAIRGLIGHPGR
jgi:hypothetical protein